MSNLEDALLDGPGALRALKFAFKAHAGQVRKFTGEPYVYHPMAVANLVARAQGASEKDVQVALLHDVIEDCGISFPTLSEAFGLPVASSVQLLSINKDKTVPRAVRKQAYRDQLKDAEPMTQTVKVADMLHNAPSLFAYDPKFYKVWGEEAKLMLDVLARADQRLSQDLNEMLTTFDVHLTRRLEVE